ncbi:MAG: rod shape-determining protein MreD [Glaciecola sp.]|jgi:rod shape-determining protein MreD
MNKNIGKYLVWFIGLLFLQVVVLSNMNASKYVLPFVYVLFLLILPKSTPRWLLLLIGFGTGCIVDTFLHSYGTHAFSCTIIAFIRPSLLATVAPKDFSSDESIISVYDLGLKKYLLYTVVLVVIHHLFVFLIDELRVGSVFNLIKQLFISSLVSTFLILCLQYIFNKKK